MEAARVELSLLSEDDRDELVDAMVRSREFHDPWITPPTTRKAFQSGYLGYSGVADLEGQGYMTEGMWLVLDYAFGELGLHRLEANSQPGNTASIALVRRCGFVKEGFSEKYLKIGGEWL